MGSIRLGKAQLCPDCQVIYDDQACPYCGAENGIWLTRIIDKARSVSDRPTVETPKQEAK